jgi:iron(III) transport system permease protein
VARTAGDTLFYAVVAAAFSVMVGFIVGVAARRSGLGQRLAVVASLGLFALPPVLMALFLISLSSRWTVGAALALRCLPIAMLFSLRAFGSMPLSWTDAGKVHEVDHATMLRRIYLPWAARWAAPAAALAALVATAEIGVVLLLHPPGHGTLPLAIFTVMANAPEALVAMLCLLYVGVAALLGGVLVILTATGRNA